MQNMGMSYLGAEVSDEELEAALMRELLQHNPPDDPWYALERADFDSLNLVLDDSQFLSTFARFLFVALAALLVWRMTQHYLNQRHHHAQARQPRGRARWSISFSAICRSLKAHRSLGRGE